MQQYVPYLYTMMKFIFTIIIIYLLYKLVFEFVLPVSKATKQVRSKIKEMQEQQESQFRQHQQNQSTVNTGRNNTPEKEADYIDFEEL